uniref:Ig-like domain-containing protein n=1 Tax=Vombatus ursinus TaxID=29139 RepID=A0A4X2LYB2_VOMUR
HTLLSLLALVPTAPRDTQTETTLEAASGSRLNQQPERTTEAQSVTQPEDQVSVSEGFPVELKCTYSSSGAVYLFWYVQYPNQELQVLLRHTSQESNKGFQAEFNKDETSYHLRKLHVREKDAAVYFCALSDTVRELTRGAEHKPPETVFE